MLGGRLTLTISQYINALSSAFCLVYLHHLLAWVESMTYEQKFAGFVVSSLAADLWSLHIPAQIVVKLIIIRWALEGAIMVQLPSGGATQVSHAGQVY